MSEYTRRLLSFYRRNASSKDANGANNLGTLEVNIPMTDTNSNGLFDFFELAHGLEGIISTGRFNNTYSVPITWHRTAGVAYGNCTFQFPDPNIVGAFVYFTSQFDLLYFDGTLGYTRESNSVTATLDTVSGMDPGLWLRGVMGLTNLSPSQLRLLTTSLTNINGQIYDLYATSLVNRSSSNYLGEVEFFDGEPNTPDDEDFFLWTLLIQDPNDTDGDKIPNLSDGGAPVLPRSPSLTLTRGPTNLSLQISGDVGSMFQIQHLITAGTTNWSNLISLTLTNDPVVVPIPFPSTMTRYWRAVAN